ncbi:hypothetical protein Plhal703r1_c18g0081851 [Plasmopara halstedii]
MPSGEVLGAKVKTNQRFCIELRKSWKVITAKSIPSTLFNFSKSLSKTSLARKIGIVTLLLQTICKKMSLYKCFSNSNFGLAPANACIQAMHLTSVRYKLVSTHKSNVFFSLDHFENITILHERWSSLGFGVISFRR